MSTQNNFNRFPFILADDLDSDLPEGMGEVETLAPEFDALPADLGEEPATLANGDAEFYWFYTGETRLRAAFCEGAGLQEMPA